MLEQVCKDAGPCVGSCGVSVRPCGEFSRPSGYRCLLSPMKSQSPRGLPAGFAVAEVKATHSCPQHRK